ncbi:hypothetical protein HQQ82_02645 [Rathayibacter sp. VKM Ac-2856]|uniref:hypothetical protein n=1 Tax=unclassified Rathayibacter TaxID=2609250 RepID=UPI001564390B|nr:MULTISPECIES: hypothetical protein [unclassified Rathayibacter]NQX03692.1 hypothetical protein [Rathayibacter sp. VKM Ac-2858]NQX18860.1 hypothetical protein [Rathayibacter sp. VKM Ac-2856]
MADPTAGIGSVADWVSGIGTLAAVFVALFLYWREQKDKKNKYIDNIVIGSDVTEAGPDDDLFSVQVRLVNTGGGVIPYAAVLGEPGIEGNKILRLYVKKPSSSPNRSVLGYYWDPIIQPGTESQVTYEYPVGTPVGEYLLVLQDAAGTTWFREVRRKKYISRSEAFSRYPALTDGSVHLTGDVL